MLLLLAAAFGQAQGTRQPAPVPFVVVLDAGHDPGSPGATSARGRAEVEFNDALVAAVARKLSESEGISPKLTRKPGARLTGTERIDRIRAAEPDLVLSIHHDSAQPQFFATWTIDGRQQQFCDRFGGYSILAPGQGKFAEVSLIAARLLAERLLQSGRKPSPHHAMQVAGEGRRWLDERLGIYDGDYVKLVREVERPVILLELGVIVNREEELWLGDPSNIESQARLIADGINTFRKKSVDRIP